MDAEGQNGAKGMWRAKTRSARMMGVSDSGTNQCSIYPYSLSWFSKHTDASLHFFAHKTKTKEARKLINLRRPKQLGDWWVMADVPEDFWFPDGPLRSSCACVSSRRRAPASCSKWLWCWCREASWTRAGSSWGCWDRPLSAFPSSDVADCTCRGGGKIDQ